MELLFPIIFLMAGILTTFTLIKTNWCDVQAKYCDGKEHVACEPNSLTINEFCSNITYIPLDVNLKNLIVDLHNQYRNDIAAGKIPGFPSAKRMGVMQWDETLQFLAEKHVIKCRFEHDQCRASPTYPYSGQNIFYQATIGIKMDPKKAIESGITGWFEEWRKARVSVVDSITLDQSKVFHFTVMANDRNNRVGCGMIQYRMPEQGMLFDAFMLTCNYEYNNILGEPTYSKGGPCSECPAKSKCSSEYKALCK